MTSMFCSRWDCEILNDVFNVHKILMQKAPLQEQNIELQYGVLSNNKVWVLLCSNGLMRKSLVAGLC
jgi:hypothetical protein